MGSLDIRKLQRKRTVFRAVMPFLVAAWMGIIFLFSAQPAEKSSDMSGSISYMAAQKYSNLWNLDWKEGQLQTAAEKIEYPIRKIAHMTEYAILALLVYGMLDAWRTGENAGGYRVALGVVFLYACSDELHQLFVPGRAGRLSDVIIDTTGALLALFVLRQIHCRINRKRKR